MLVKVVPDSESEPASTSMDLIGARLDDVQDWAELRRAGASLIVVDRETEESVGIDEHEPILTASLAKLFIASQLAFLEATGVRPVAPEDDMLLGQMLSASEDVAATILWDQMGGPAVVGAVAERFGLGATAPSEDGPWWHTRTTASDVATLYDRLLDDLDAAHSVPVGIVAPGPSWAERILGHLHNWTDVGADGYDQRFGLVGVFERDDLVAVKQGWMCCVGPQWIHLTTGVLGPAGRYIVVVQVAEDVQYSDGRPDLPQTSEGIDLADESAAHARDTVTGLVATLFRDGVPEGGSCRRGLI
ncbi:hypothetical protein GCM10022231_28800 [Gordonia caeni]|uniref:Serine hydrolase n=1 Tax=Gordonia caeni TaxID=1007097 RepID=A0ABP7PIF1_9ACTN